MPLTLLQNPFQRIDRTVHAFCLLRWHILCHLCGAAGSQSLFDLVLTKARQ